MVRSSGFGSTTCYSFALFRLAFAPAPRLYRLTSQHIVTRRPVLQKVRDQACLHRCRRCPLSACKHTVSGSLSLPSRGAFHLSLTVLYSIGHQVVFSLGRWASRLPTEFLVLDGTLVLHSSIPPISPTGLLPCLASFPLIFGYLCMSFFVKSEPRTYFYMRFRLLPFRSPLLR